MRDAVTPEQVAEYQENGFLVIDDFLSDEEAAHWSRTTDEAVAQRLADRAGPLNNQGNPDDYYAQVFTQCLKLADSHTGMRGLMHDLRLGRVAATLAGVGLGLGLLLTLAAQHTLRALVELHPQHEPSLLAATGLGLLAVCTVAAFLPARRAAAIDPIQALRTE